MAGRDNRYVYINAPAAYRIEKEPIRLPQSTFFFFLLYPVIVVPSPYNVLRYNPRKCSQRALGHKLTWPVCVRSLCLLETSSARLRGFALGVVTPSLLQKKKDYSLFLM